MKLPDHPPAGMVTRRGREDGRSNAYSRRKIVSVVTPQNPTVVRHIPVTRLADAVAPGTAACTVFRIEKIAGIPRVAIANTNAQIVKVRVIVISKKLKWRTPVPLRGGIPRGLKRKKSNELKLGSSRSADGESNVNGKQLSYCLTHSPRQGHLASAIFLHIRRCPYGQLQSTRYLANLKILTTKFEQ